MKKFIIAAAVATSALTAAVPAAAQYYPGQGYGYNQGGLVRSYIVRADQLRQRIDQLDRRDRISNREADRLRRAAADLQGRTRAYARDGLSNRERYELDQRFAQLQQAIRYERFDGNDRRGGRWDNDDRRDGRWDNDDRRDGRWNDRDRDGRDDRYEDDRGRYPG